VNVKVFGQRFGSTRRLAWSGAETLLSTVRSLLDRPQVEEPPPREPYLQGVTASSATIAWVGDEYGVGTVEYGETPQLGREQVDTNVGRRHAVTLTDLEPASTYHYRVVQTNGSSGTDRFRTAPADEDSRFSFAVVGDSGDGGRAQLEVAGLLERLRPDLIPARRGRGLPPWSREGLRQAFLRAVPYPHQGGAIFLVLGNHDVRHRDGAAYLDNFYPPLHNPGSTKRFYSFDWGGAYFVALDSELYHDDRGAGPEEQKAFLERDLAATRKRWKFAFLHRSLYSSSRHGPDELIREDLEPLFARYGVDVVFSGHDHVYERTAPVMGVTHVVSGGGGRELSLTTWRRVSKGVHSRGYRDTGKPRELRSSTIRTGRFARRRTFSATLAPKIRSKRVPLRPPIIIRPASISSLRRRSSFSGLPSL
jgi:Calcineurin-like phosphoesterase/Purple acid Phosphatase, N-terminal domain